MDDLQTTNAEMEQKVKDEDSVNKEADNQPNTKPKKQRFKLPTLKRPKGGGECELDVLTPEPTATSEPTESADVKSKRHDYNSFITRALGGLYTMLIIILGFVLTLANALTHRLGEESYYLQIFDTYLYGVSICFLVFLHAVLMRPTKPGDAERNNNANEKALTHEHAMTEGYREPTPHVSFEAEGVNFYLRLGAIGFGTAAVIHDGFRLVQYVEHSERAFACRGPFNIVVVILHMVFTFYQTYFLFKYHKIVVRTHKSIAKLGFMHMAATNLCVWCATVIFETHEEFLVSLHHGSHHDEVEHTTGHAVGHGGHSSHGHGLGTTTSHFNDTEDLLHDLHLCTPEDSLSMQASPYLFPCTIEYSLTGAAMMYKICHVVGKPSHELLEYLDFLPPQYSEASGGVDCDKANKGLFMGLFIVILTLIAVSCYFVFDDEMYGGQSSALTFFITEILLLLLMAGTIIVAYFKFRKLRFILRFEEHLDQTLLVVCAFGIFVLQCFHIVSSFGTLTTGGLISILAAITSVLALSQTGMQTLFIIDGLHRSANSPSESRAKPGRALVTLLLLCNLAFWIVCVFEVKKAEHLPVHNVFYGQLPWNIISHVCLPLIIFYRFHSTVLLSDIWSNAYLFHSHKTV